MYEVIFKFTQLVGVDGGAIRAVVVDNTTGREVTNQTFINRPLITADNLKDEIMYAAKRLCGVKEEKKPVRKQAPVKEKGVATATVTKEVRK